MRRNLDGHHGENGRPAPTFHVDALGGRNPDTVFVRNALNREKSSENRRQTALDGNSEISATRRKSPRRRPSRFNRFARRAGSSAMTITSSKKRSTGSRSAARRFSR